MNKPLTTAMVHWPILRQVLSVPHTEAEYEDLLRALKELIDLVGDDETSPLTGLLETLGALVEVYESRHVAEPMVTGAQMLRFLMEQHQLRQRDLPELGSQGVVSEILAGKRQLNLRQIQYLCARFGLEPGAFLG